MPRQLGMNSTHESTARIKPPDLPILSTVSRETLGRLEHLIGDL
jgi:hypothetical protein